MRLNGWLSKVYSRKIRKYNFYQGQVGRIVPNKINRRFKTDRPYQKLTTDISEFRYGNLNTDHRIYFSPIMDMYSGEIVSFNISDHPTVECFLKPLNKVLRLTKKTIHSDQGVQYQSHNWRSALKDNHIFQSMSRKGNCLDNVPMESFFHIMKAEIMDKHYDSKNNLILAMKLWIKYYNNYRIKTKLGGKSPVQYRKFSA